MEISFDPHHDDELFQLDDDLSLNIHIQDLKFHAVNLFIHQVRVFHLVSFTH